MIDANIELLNETLINIFKNYIPTKIVKFDYRQSPWVNDNIKGKLNQKTKLTQYCYKNCQINSDRDKILEKICRMSRGKS